MSLIMVLYPFVASLTLNPSTGETVGGATGEVYAKADTTFTTPLAAVDASGSPVTLTSNASGVLPSFYVDGYTAVNWKSGEWVFPLVTSEPVEGPEGPAGVSVNGATLTGDQLELSLSNGTTTAPVTLPPGPGGSDAGVASYITTPGTETAAALDVAYASSEMVEPMLLQDAASSKGGVIGVGDKGALAIRFDDWHAAFKANIYSLMLARGLPAGYATISRLSEQSWTSGVTTADLVAWNKNGIEFWSHGTNHNDPTPEGRAGLIDQIVNSKAEIEAWDVKCQGWMQPGATPLTAEPPYGQTGEFTDLTNEAGQLIRQTYPLSEMYVWGVYRNLPHGAYHGLDHVTVSDGMTLANAKINVDTAVNLKIGVELMVHSGNLGGSGMSVADFTALLDYIVAYRDAGKLEVLTPSGLMFADKSTRRLDLLADGSFEGMTTGDVSPPAAWNVSFTGGITIETTGGRTGSKFIRFPSTAANFAIQYATNLKKRNLSGETFVFEGWARSNGAGTTTSRVLIQDYDDTTRFNLSLTRGSIGTTWTKVIHAVTIPPLTNRLTFGISRSSGDGIDWDDVKLHKV